MKPTVALLVHACDRYRFLYRGFEYFFNQHWDFSIPCKLYFATEEETADVKGFENIRSGKGPWADRLKRLLAAIPEQYVLYMQEDMWLTKQVNAKFFTELFSDFEKNKGVLVKLHSSSVYRTRPGSTFIEGFNISIVDNHASEYLMSHQVSLWDKNFYTAQLLPGEHPWRNERRGSARMKKLDPQILHADYFAENGSPEINDNHAPQMRSEYFAVSFNGMLHPHIEKFLPALLAGGPAEQAYAVELQHHYQNGLTHDGKPKPRKEDIFKKLKKIFRKPD